MPDSGYSKGVKVEWDERKNTKNQAKHGVSFEEAREIFASGQEYLELYDDAHSTFEDRFIAIGIIPRGLAVVLLTERDDDIIRIISARWATRREQHMYNTYMERRHE